MSQTINTCEANILKPLKNFELVDAVYNQASGMKNIRLCDHFLQVHEDIRDTCLGKELFKFSCANELITALLWTLWKKCQHISFIVSDETIMNDLSFLVGEEELNEAQENAGSRSREEFCNRVRDFLHDTWREYYSGCIGCIYRVWDRLKGCITQKKSNKIPLLGVR